MKNLLPIFIKEVSTDRRYMSISQAYLWEVYLQLFKMLNYTSPNALDYVYKEWLEQEDWKKDKEDEKGFWFFSFHKSIRQCDLYDNAYMTVRPDNPLNDDELKRYQELRKQWIDSREFLNNYEWCSDEYHLAEAQWKIDNRELRSEYSKLSMKREAKDTESIAGHLDMVFWNMIHVDKEEVLYKTLDRFFNDIRTEFIKIE